LIIFLVDFYLFFILFFWSHSQNAGERLSCICVCVRVERATLFEFHSMEFGVLEMPKHGQDSYCLLARLQNSSRRLRHQFKLGKALCSGVTKALAQHTNNCSSFSFFRFYNNIDRFVISTWSGLINFHTENGLWTLLNSKERGQREHQLTVAFRFQAARLSHAHKHHRENTYTTVRHQCSLIRMGRNHRSARFKPECEPHLSTVRN